jgi:hypothetical protein
MSVIIRSASPARRSESWIEVSRSPSAVSTLTRQVAALDATEKGHTGLVSYYAARGESPGVWIGSGMDGIEGLAAGDPPAACLTDCWLITVSSSTAALH